MDTTENSVIDIRKAIVKARILSGIYLLQKKQTKKHTFSQYREEPICKLYKQQEADVLHMLLDCPLLRETKIDSFRILKETVINYICIESCKTFSQQKKTLSSSL